MIIRTSQSHNERGARISATSKKNQNKEGLLYRRTVPYDYALDRPINHIEAAQALAARKGKGSVLEVGSHRDGFSFITEIQ